MKKIIILIVTMIITLSCTVNNSRIQKYHSTNDSPHAHASIRINKDNIDLGFQMINSTKKNYVLPKLEDKKYSNGEITVKLFDNGDIEIIKENKTIRLYEIDDEDLENFGHTKGNEHIGHSH